MAIPEYIAKLRQHIGNDLLQVIAATGLIYDKEGRILLQKTQDEDLDWTVPSGLIELGETPAECLIREMKEETGLDIKPTELVAVLGGPKHRYTYPNGHQVEAILIVFKCEVLGGELGALDDEITALKYFSEDELPDKVQQFYASELLFGQANQAYFH